MVKPHFCRHLLTVCGFQVTVLIHSAFMALTILAALTFKPLQAVERKSEENKKQHEQGTFTCISCTRGLWFPKLGQIFIWKVLRNPLFILLTVSVIMGRWEQYRDNYELVFFLRTAMRGFGMIVPAFGESIGLSKENSTYLLTAMSVADFCSRYLYL